MMGSGMPFFLKIQSECYIDNKLLNTANLQVCLSSDFVHFYIWGNDKSMLILGKICGLWQMVLIIKVRVNIEHFSYVRRKLDSNR